MTNDSQRAIADTASGRPLALSSIREAAFSKLGIALHNNLDAVPPGTLCLANESIMVQTSLLTEETTFGIGYGNDPGNGLKKLRDFLAPTRQSNTRTIRLTQYDENEPWMTVDYQKVKRGILGDFAEVRQRTATKVDRMVLNRGLSVVLDMDELKERPNWQQTHTKWIIDMLMRASVLEAVAVYQAAATVNNLTWDTASNPDLDVLNSILVEANITGFYPNRSAYGDLASFKRRRAYENQLTAGSLARSMAVSEEEIAEVTQVSQCLINAERYQNAASTAKQEIIGSNVFLFTAVDGPSVEDPSNLVRHVANTSFGGGEYAVYITPHGPKKNILTVENYELMQTQHTTGILQLAIT